MDLRTGVSLAYRIRDDQLSLLFATLKRHLMQLSITLNKNFKV